MKNRALIFVLLFSTTVFAAKVNNPNCKDVDQVNEKFTPQYLAVIDGYNKAGQEVGEVDMGGIITESAGVKKECEKNKNAKVETVRKTFARQIKKSTTKANIFSPTKAKCQEFLTLDDKIQPIVAYWAAGHLKPGKFKGGEIDDVFLDHPIASLLEDCKAAPTAFFYDKAKTWVKKQM